MTTCCLQCVDNLTIGCWDCCFAPSRTDLADVASTLKTGDLFICRAHSSGRTAGQVSAEIRADYTVSRHTAHLCHRLDSTGSSCNEYIETPHFFSFTLVTSFYGNPYCLTPRMLAICLMHPSTQFQARHGTT